MLFIFSFILLVPLVFLNLFIAIILQGYEDSSAREKTAFNTETMDTFRYVWAEHDPDGSTFINIPELPDILLKIGEPLGWDTSY